MPALNYPAIVVLLTLIVAANGMPWLLARGCIRRRFAALGAWPIDGGRLLSDGQPLLGRTKTWRGLAGALLVTPLVAMLLGCDWWLGLAVAAAAMAGDLLASFVKRRLGLASSTDAPGLDQVPEALLPALAAKAALGLGWFDLAVIVVAFLLGHLWTMRHIGGAGRSG
ncbi:CDP-archaeol synthase [Thiohalocapsa marina]|uniref:CDP-archaeol synthase n=1 Tax=Thiohalocapsa marina TaxID=424902 RepID=A0A5M8FMC8_9GAMM|nr:CDP-archaeol synthase [Thiohalocapsa marina]KAA6185170.1 CDP-archaeol synthase [Thiohalocapsa marina]